MKPLERYRVDFDALKRRPFEELVANWGYVRDPEASTRGSSVLRAPGQPKLVIKQHDNGHWVYFNTCADDDNGTIIDFMLNRDLSFDDIRARFGTITTASADFNSQWNAAEPEPNMDWLTKRGIRSETLAVYRPMIRGDHSGRLLFAHRDRNRRLTGFEIGPPNGRKRFVSGGKRSLFAVCAGTAKTIKALVITESAVDALSLAQLDGCPADHAFLSTAGSSSRSQHEQISFAATILPSVRTIILAQDSDTAGDRQAAKLHERLQRLPNITPTRRRPPASKDWNDLVKVARKT